MKRILIPLYFRIFQRFRFIFLKHSKLYTLLYETLNAVKHYNSKCRPCIPLTENQQINSSYIAAFQHVWGIKYGNTEAIVRCCEWNNCRYFKICMVLSHNSNCIISRRIFFNCCTLNPLFALNYIKRFFSKYCFKTKTRNLN